MLLVTVRLLQKFFFRYADNMEDLLKSLALKHMPGNMQAIDRKKAGKAVSHHTVQHKKYQSLITFTCNKHMKTYDGSMVIHSMPSCFT